jgi:dTDP-L-rhamnose 4-epimerase
VLGYEPQVAFEDGLEELGEWLAGQVAHDRVERATAELQAMGLHV